MVRCLCTSLSPELDGLTEHCISSESDVVARESQLALENKINALIEGNTETQRRIERVEELLNQLIDSGANSFVRGCLSTASKAQNMAENDSLTIRRSVDLQAEPSLCLPSPCIRTAEDVLSIAGESSSTTDGASYTRLASMPSVILQGTANSSSGSSNDASLRLEFEATLETTGVYRRVNRPFDSFSILSADDRSVARTVMTSYTLADDASILSAFPIMNRKDLQYPEFYPNETTGDRKQSQGLLSVVAARGVSTSATGNSALAGISLKNFRFPPNCGERVMGRWNESVHRIWRPSEFRFEVKFSVPIIFMTYPNNKKGPIAGEQVYCLDGSEASLENTWTELQGQGRNPMYTKNAALDNARASWVTLLSALQTMQRRSHEWEVSFCGGEPCTLDNPPVLRRVKQQYTLVAALQRKRTSWDAIPPGIRRPYATTTMCHVVEMLAVSGVHWLEFDRKNDRYLAEGNGYIVRGDRVSDLGIMFEFQIYKKNRFEENSIVPVREVKEFCFGFVPTIYRYPSCVDSRRWSFPDALLEDLCVVRLSSKAEIAQTLVMIGCCNQTFPSTRQGEHCPALSRPN